MGDSDGFQTWLAPGSKIIKPDQTPKTSYASNDMSNPLQEIFPASPPFRRSPARDPDTWRHGTGSA